MLEMQQILLKQLLIQTDRNHQMHLERLLLGHQQENQSQMLLML